MSGVRVFGVAGFFTGVLACCCRTSCCCCCEIGGDTFATARLAAASLIALETTKGVSATRFSTGLDWVGELACTLNVVSSRPFRGRNGDGPCAPVRRIEVTRCFEAWQWLIYARHIVNIFPTRTVAAMREVGLTGDDDEDSESGEIA